MKSRTSRTRKLSEVLASCFAPDRNVSRAQIDAAAQRVLHRLRTEPKWESSVPLFDTAVRPARQPLYLLAAVAAAAILIVVVSYRWPAADSLGRVEAADGALDAVGGETRHLRQGDSIDANEVLRANGGGGAMLALADGSRVEMRARSELSFERADDGVWIHLATGGIIVNAARQQSGHLYVQTKDMTVTVVGTVFVVNAEHDGSRVAVIEGELRVREGNTETNLRPGEQVSTSHTLQVRPLAEEIAWSRRAAVHLALLQQAVPQSPAQRDPPALPAAFDVVSIRQNVSGTGAPTTRIEGGRFVASNVTLQQLISDAYRLPVAGGPEWIKDVRGPIRPGQIRFDVTATIPPESPAGRIPLMVRAMLAERFKLVVHSETQEREVYALVHAREDKRRGPQLTPSTQQCQVEIEAGPLRAPVRRVTEDGKPVCGMMISPTAIRGGGLTLRFLANAMNGSAGRSVVDRTGLEGPYDFELRFAPPTARSPSTPPGADGGSPPSDDRPSIFVAVQEQLGLKLEATTAPVEVLVVDSVSMPAEN